MDIFELTSNMGHEFEFKDTIHPGYRGLIIPQASPISLHGGFGEFVMQQLIRPEFDLWYNNYLSRQRFMTHATANVSLIELSILLEKSATYTMEGTIGKIHQRRGQFNIIHSLLLDTKVQFEKSSLYITLDIHAKYRLLKRLYALYPKLMEPLMNAIAANREYEFFEKPIDLTPEMMRLVEYIIRLLKNPILDVYHLDIAVIALFSHAIAFKDQTLSKGLSYRKKQLYQEQLNNLLQVLYTDKNFMGINYYAKNTGMSDTVLMENFKKMFGKTLKQSWRENIMQKAYYEVINTDKTYDEIAFQYGYADGASFSKAFKKIYHQTPSEARMENKLKN